MEIKVEASISFHMCGFGSILSILTCKCQSGDNACKETYVGCEVVGQKPVLGGTHIWVGGPSFEVPAVVRKYLILGQDTVGWRSFLVVSQEPFWVPVVKRDAILWYQLLERTHIGVGHYPFLGTGSWKGPTVGLDRSNFWVLVRMHTSG